MVEWLVYMKVSKLFYHVVNSPVSSSNPTLCCPFYLVKTRSLTSTKVPFFDWLSRVSCDWLKLVSLDACPCTIDIPSSKTTRSLPPAGLIFINYVHAGYVYPPGTQVGRSQVLAQFGLRAPAVPRIYPCHLGSLGHFGMVHELDHDIVWHHGSPVNTETRPGDHVMPTWTYFLIFTLTPTFHFIDANFLFYWRQLFFYWRQLFFIDTNPIHHSGINVQRNHHMNRSTLMSCWEHG